MQKRIYLIAIALCAILGLQAEVTSQWIFGLRGGIENYWMQANPTVQTSHQPAGNVDIRYGFYAPVGKPTQVGLQLGLGLGYAQSAFKGSFTEQYTNTDYLGLEMQYNNAANYTNSVQRLYLEVPLLISLRSHGFVLGAGAKFQMPVWTESKQSLSDINIDAYYPRYSVHVPNELITGVVANTESSGANLWQNAKYNVLVSLQTGYEWQVKPQHHIGLMVYVDYNVWNSYRPTASPIIDVASISNIVYPVPEVTVKNAPSVLTQSLHPLQAGLSLYYAFSPKEKESKEIETQIVYRTDTITRIDTMRIHDTDTLRLYQTTLDTVYIHDTIYVNGNAIVIDTAVVKDHALSPDERELLKTITRANIAEFYYPSGASNATGNTYLMSCVREIAAKLRANPDMHIRIVGHTDSTGDHTSNVVVGQRRADAVKIEMLKLGVPTGQIETTSMAETQPIAPNDTSTNRDRNRRVEIQLL